MAELPKEIIDSPTVKAIYASYEKKHEGPRRYLGASVVGKACARALWYEFRWCGRQIFDGRMLRLFQHGVVEEVRIIHDLRAIGVEVHEVDPTTGQQFAVSTIGGHFGGHLDGCCVGLPEAPKVWHVCEFKTHNAKSFAAMIKGGVEKAKPEHFAQMQCYMHLTGMERAVYIAVNKDTDEIYFERIKYDFNVASRIMATAQQIIAANEPPARVSEDREFYQCRWCCHNARCHGPADDEAAVPCNVTCRSCCHATPVTEGEGGVWRCEKHDKTLSEQEQEKACGDHIFLPGLVTFAEPVDSDGQSIDFKSKDGHEWRHGGDGWSSLELTKLTIGGMAVPAVVTTKQRLGGVVVTESEAGL